MKDFLYLCAWQGFGCHGSPLDFLFPTDGFDASGSFFRVGPSFIFLTVYIFKNKLIIWRKKLSCCLRTQNTRVVTLDNAPCLTACFGPALLSIHKMVIPQWIERAQKDKKTKKKKCVIFKWKWGLSHYYKVNADEERLLQMSPVMRVRAIQDLLICL